MSTNTTKRIVAEKRITIDPRSIMGFEELIQRHFTSLLGIFFSEKIYITDNVYVKTTLKIDPVNFDKPTLSKTIINAFMVMIEFQLLNNDEVVKEGYYKDIVYPTVDFNNHLSYRAESDFLEISKVFDKVVVKHMESARKLDLGVTVGEWTFKLNAAEGRVFIEANNNLNSSLTLPLYSRAKNHKWLAVYNDIPAMQVVMNELLCIVANNPVLTITNEPINGFKNILSEILLETTVNESLIKTLFHINIMDDSSVYVAEKKIDKTPPPPVTTPKETNRVYAMLKKIGLV